MIIHEFDLDMIPDNAITTVKVNQYDDDFNLKINLFSRKGGLTIQAGTEVIIRGKKPDGHVFSADCSINGNVVTVVGNQQMTAAAGRAIFELSLRKNGKELNSANFIMKVERAPMDKDTPPSNSVIRELVDALDHTEEILEAAESVEEWLSTIDDTLSQPNKAADAKKTGDEIADLKSALITATDDGEGNLTFIKGNSDGSGGQSGIVNVDTSKLIVGGLVNASRSGTYVDPSKTVRISYKPFDILITPGTYVVHWDSSLNLNCSAIIYNEIARNSVSNNQDINTNNNLVPGWKDNNASFTVPDKINNSDPWCVRLNWKTVPTEAVFSSTNVISNVTITKV